jgi:uncharacterized protein YunC (DUF1805 family)
MLMAKVAGASTAAAEIGIQVGMSGAEALELIR